MQLYTRFTNYFDRVLKYKKHFAQIKFLWLASFLRSLFNFLSNIIIISSTNVETYALLTVSIALQMLSGQLAGAGVDSSVELLATQTENIANRTKIYKKAALSILPRTIVQSLLLTSAFSLLLIFQKNYNEKQSIFIFILIFSGLFTTFAQINNRLIYSTGSFTYYGFSIIVAPAINLSILCICSFSSLITSFDMFFIVKLYFGIKFFEWFVSSYLYNKQISKMATTDYDLTLNEAKKKVLKIQKPIMLALYFNAISFNSLLLGSSFFASNVAIASFGIFQKALKIFNLFTGTTIEYGVRKLRLSIKFDEKLSKERLIISSSIFLYTTFAIVCIILYYIAGKYSFHYAFTKPLAFAVFLGGNMFGFLGTVIDNIIFAREKTTHRVWGSIMLFVLNIGLITIFKPNSLMAMVIIQSIPAISVCIFYYQFWKKSICN